MPRILIAVAFGFGLTTAASADEPPAPLPQVCETCPPVVTAAPAKPRPGRILTDFARPREPRGRAWLNRRPFQIDGTVYEPTLRDIRLVPPSRTLPGADSGIVETLPILPPRVDGYFLMPAVR